MGFYAREAAREPDEIQALSFPVTWVPGFLWLLFGVSPVFGNPKGSKAQALNATRNLNQNTAAQRFKD